MAPLGQGTIGELGLGEITTGSTIPALSSLLPWFVPLSEPVRFRPGLKASEQQFIAFHPTPVVSFSWFEALSEPPRFPRRLPPGEVQFDAYVPNPITVTPFAWFMPLSEPPRFPVGLKAPLQQFEARPPQLRPNPAITGIMRALETKDVFLAGATEFNRAASAEIGIEDTSTAAVAAGAGLPTVASVSISISII
jgi:hypothetical protein